MENNKVRMSDAELEAGLKPYIRIIALCGILEIAAVMLLVLGIVLLCAHVVGIPAGLLIIAAGAALMILLRMISASNKKKYDKLFMEQRGNDIEESVASYFGPKPDSEESGEATAERLQKTMRESGIFGGWKRASVNSYRMGTWKGMSFEAFNAVLEKEIKVEEVGSEGGIEITTKLETMFDGCFFLCQTGTEAPCRLAIQRIDDAERRESFSDFRTGVSEFDGKYGVCASDPAAASACLTPEALRCISGLEALSGGEIGISVQDHMLILAIRSGHTFMNMGGANTAHISDLMTNLNASLEETAGILNKVLACSAFFHGVSAS